MINRETSPACGDLDALPLDFFSEGRDIGGCVRAKSRVKEPGGDNDQGTGW